MEKSFSNKRKDLEKVSFFKGKILGISMYESYAIAHGFALPCQKFEPKVNHL